MARTTIAQSTDIVKSDADKLDLMRKQGIPILNDLVASGELPERKKPWSPETFVGRFMVILTDEIVIEEIPNPYADVPPMVRGIRMEVIDPETGEQNRFTSLSQALVAHVEEQILPFTEKIGFRIAVFVNVKPHARRGDKQPVYEFL